MEIQGNQTNDSYNSSAETGSTSEPGSFKDEEKCLEITLDVGDDLALVQNSRKRDSAESNQIDQNMSADTARVFKGLKFVNDRNALYGHGGWPEIEQRFKRLAKFGILSKSDFAQCIGVGRDSSDFTNELFDALARPRDITSASLLKDELHEFWEQITNQSLDVRLETFLDMVDKDGDGRITKEEVKEITMLSAGANNLAMSAEKCAALVMEELDPDGLGYIEINDLKRLLLTGPAKLSNIKMDLNNFVLRKSTSMKVGKKDYSPIYRWLKYFVEDNWRQIWVVGLWLAICTCLFMWKFFQYKNQAIFKVMGYCVTTATGTAETLKFNMALILLPVCRNTITWLRSNTKLGVVVPFDDNINFHKVIAAGITIGVSVHAGAHLICDFPRLLRAPTEEYNPIKPLFGEARPNNYWWFLKNIKGWTGLVMVVLMVIAFTLAHPLFRRNRLNHPRTLRRLSGFNAFWYSHHLFVIVYVIFVIHGSHLYLPNKWYNKTTWMYLAVPILLYVCERMIRAYRSHYQKVEILKVGVYLGNVLVIQIDKPHGFKYISGQYIYIKCPIISPFEWHPFSLTSAPGDDYLSVHIRTLGDWTMQLKSIFSKVCQPTSINQGGILKVDVEQANHIHRMPILQIDGPYGAASQEYKDYEVVLLIGLGIGATPMISILKDVLYDVKQQREMEDRMVEKNGVNKRNKRKLIAPKKAYFYWVIREQASFEWFLGVLNEVAENDSDGVIEIHSYCTSIYEEGDARSAWITMLQSLNHAKKGVDIVSGTNVKAHFARPNWGDVFEGLATNHVDQRIEMCQLNEIDVPLYLLLHPSFENINYGLEI
ncbi:respiratory burst oxidase homolog protein B-like isoform X2 [Humulus lupulus]|uniref:respiratory burst oxidase homolog protein B-like isoform X2 n=1 Tax=Humulus lupulus TaxID=3486 RepID=UPI002B40356E|nr:respiratory burst oxidase homolog protein B-like isoform X2 [Humulus lupulus]